MATQPRSRLDDTAFAVLGLIALRGPSTAYEIERALSRITSQFWSVPHVTPYRATRQLEREGMLTAEQERGGRRRRVYSLTDEGRSALRAWLAEPSSETMTIRDPGQLRLLFAELTDPAALAELARAQIRVYEARLAELDATEARLAGDVVRAVRLGPLQLGRAVYSAALAFWTSVAAAPDLPASWTAGEFRGSMTSRR
jgi:PadR family transcriptional regulator, regulatory protein AphA